MRLHQIYLSGLTILLSSARIVVEASVLGSDDLLSEFSNAASFRATSTTDISTTRFLRASQSDADEDDERADPSVPAIEKLKTVFTSSKVNPEKLQRWLDKGKSADTVFTRLHLTGVGDLLFYYPQFATWVQYVDDLSAKTLGKGTSAISTLTARYGDDALYKIIDDAKFVPRFETLAKKLQSEQMQHWVTIRKDPDEVFHLFKLDKTPKHILSNPQFAIWAKYVDDLNVKNPKEAASVIPTLRKYFLDDVLLKMTEAAKRVEGTKSIATKVEDDMLRVWLNSQKTPDKVFGELGLGYSANTLLENPLLNVWTKYIETFNIKYPDRKTTMIETFTRFSKMTVWRNVFCLCVENSSR